jgi:divalent metal cation (Fe/Co/Zn/Cd) transporter
VIGFEPGAAVGQGHAAADRVEAAVQGALPGSDVVVHVEPQSVEGLRERAAAAALSVPAVREIHNVSVMQVDGANEVSLHLKLPGELPLEDAHEVAEQVERAIRESLPEVASVQTHMEPLTEQVRVQTAENVDEERGIVTRIVRDALGRDPRELRFLNTDEGLVAFLTLGLDPGSSLADAHAAASEIEARVRDARPDIADVIVHTEP